MVPAAVTVSAAVTAGSDFVEHGNGTACSGGHGLFEPRRAFGDRYLGDAWPRRGSAGYATTWAPASSQAAPITSVSRSAARRAAASRRSTRTCLKC